MRLLALFLILFSFPALAQSGVAEGVRGEPDGGSGFALHPEYPANSPHMATPTCVTYPEWIGQHVNEINKSVLGNRTYRILGPNTPATMDYSPDRLNINTDDNGIVVEQICG